MPAITPDREPNPDAGHASAAAGTDPATPTGRVADLIGRWITAGRNPSGFDLLTLARDLPRADARGVFLAIAGTVCAADPEARAHLRRLVDQAPG